MAASRLTPAQGRSLYAQEVTTKERATPDQDLSYTAPDVRRVARIRISLQVRVRTFLNRDRLDDELAHRVEPHATPEHTLGAVQLCSPDFRRRSANCLVVCLGNARGLRGQPFTVAAQRERAAIVASYM